MSRKQQDIRCFLTQNPNPVKRTAVQAEDSADDDPVPATLPAAVPLQGQEPSSSFGLPVSQQHRELTRTVSNISIEEIEIEEPVEPDQEQINEKRKEYLLKPQTLPDEYKLQPLVDFDIGDEL
jgi:pyridoxine 5'-phosphate synthase PdxJ